MSNISNKIMAEKTASLELMKAYTSDDKPFYAYVVMREADIAVQKTTKADKLRRLPENSVVLYSDYGHEVPAGVEEQVMIEFNKMLKNSA